jgi:7-cyano-7-deazaguanine reductase
MDAGGVLDGLKQLPNPSSEGYEIKHVCPEVTFLGADGQPDFATLTILLYPAKSVIELRSLKLYLYQFRAKVVSYERLINTVYADLMRIYEPNRLRLIMATNVRGGISSILKIDSDWTCRGGQEEFKDWKNVDDE